MSVIASLMTLSSACHVETQGQKGLHNVVLLNSQALLVLYTPKLIDAHIMHVCADFASNF